MSLLLKECRICKCKNLINIISLKDQVITSRFPIYGDFSTPKTPIILCMCNDCGLVQLLQTTDASELYEHEYGYRSGISNTMIAHLKSYQEEILTMVHLQDGDTVVDIGSNDATMLHFYSDKLKRIGIDPTGLQFKQYYGDVELIPTYFTKDNFKNVYGEKKCKIVSSISMFYDLPDPVQFAQDIYDILEEDGIWTCEQSYLLTMLRMNSIDTICHEHLEYYALKQVKYIADKVNFNIIDVKFNDCNGGSFRVYFSKNQKLTNKCLVDSILQDEHDYGIHLVSTFSTFIKKCDIEVMKLVEFINTVNKNAKQVYIYGASTKGNCLLQYANICQKMIKYAVERNPKKIGKMTSTGIEIISEETMRINPPAFLLVLPWHFKKEIIEREAEYLKNGGQLIFPFPHFEVIGYTSKILITGCDGLIGTEVKKVYNNNSLYGICKCIPTHLDSSNIVKFSMDINNRDQLEKVLLIIKPDIIIHLSGISSSFVALNNPINTIISNGLVTAHLCDIIHQNKMKTKLFNASSSTMFAGHGDYDTKEDDTHMYNLHPYAIAKIMGHSLINFYRNVHNLPFSNGILFTIESRKKRAEFLLNRVADHIQKGTNTPLVVGNLESYRNILHVSDAATAIKIIMSQEQGDTYCICNKNSVKMVDLIIKLYEKQNIQIIEKDNGDLYDIKTNLPLVIISSNLGDANINNIRGNSIKLNNLGWFPKMTVDDIIDDICNK